MALPSSSSSSPLLLLLRSPTPSAHPAIDHQFLALNSRLGFRRDQDASYVSRGTKNHASRLLALATKGDSNKEVVMVDPLEAKRLAAKQMEEIQAKERYQRQREIEAINGGWAMIGLTAGLVVEGHTGNGILKQLVSYWDAIVRTVFH